MFEICRKAHKKLKIWNKPKTFTWKINEQFEKKA